MDSARWERIQALFHEAAARPAPERISFLRTAAGGDERLIADVLAMLEEDARGASLLDRDVAQVAGQMLGHAGVARPPFQDFGPYKIRGVLGEGGMGVVYLAEREDLGSLVAIKLLRDAWMSPARRERFTSEQRTLAQLNHPSIARLYDADTLPDGTPWFVMEYVDGVPLTGYCSRHNCSIEERLKLFRAVCEAVQYAHQRAIIHRDLKPSNILVKGDGSVRLLDFGIAKQLDPLDTPVDQTRTGTRLMTPAYAAPEQVRGDRVGVHTDVYSLGVILYELLAGRLPFDVSHQTPAEAAAMIATDEPAKPSAAAHQTRARVPAADKASWADLDVLCLTAMHQDPKRRYQSAEALIRDVDHYLKNEPLEARLDTLSYILTKFVRRNWQALSASAVMFAVVVGLALIVGLVLSFDIYRKSSSSKPRARTIAVLPFQNTGSDHSLDFLRLALADEIATTLSYTRSLSVRPFASTRKYIEPNLDLQKAGQEMRVATIVTGHFLRAGEQLQITLEAVDVESNRLLRRDTFDVPAQNMIAMQSQIAARAQGGLAQLLGSSPFGTDTAAHAKNEEAYDLFLRSTAVPMDSTTNKQGIAMLERSVGLDPTFSPAWYALARRYYVEGHYAKGGEAMRERYEAAVERALALDPNSMAAGAGLVLTLVERGQLIKAYQQAEGLVRRRPDSADAHFSLSYVLRYAGLLDEAAGQCESAFALDAQSQTSGVKSCAIVFFLRGDYNRAMDYIHLDLGSAWAKTLSIDVLVRQGKEKEALQVELTSAPQWGGFDLLLASLRHKPLREITALARTVLPVEDPEANYFSAAHLAYSGQTSAALRMLKRAVQGSYCSFPAIDSDPLFAGLRAQPEFAEIRSAAVACQNNFLAQREKHPQ